MEVAELVVEVEARVVDADEEGRAGEGVGALIGRGLDETAIALAIKMLFVYNVVVK